MKNCLILFLLLHSSISIALNYSSIAFEKNNKVIQLSFHKNSLGKSLQLLNEAIAIDSSYALVYINKAQCLTRLGRQSEALHTIFAAEKYSLGNPCYYPIKGFNLERSRGKATTDIKLKIN